jgi:hypothetical protein
MCCSFKIIFSLTPGFNLVLDQGGQASRFNGLVAPLKAAEAAGVFLLPRSPG